MGLMRPHLQNLCIISASNVSRKCLGDPPLSTVSMDRRPDKQNATSSSTSDAQYQEIVTYEDHTPPGRTASVNWQVECLVLLGRSCRRTSTAVLPYGTALDWTRHCPCTPARKPSVDAAHGLQSAADDTRAECRFHLSAAAAAATALLNHFT